VDYHTFVAMIPALKRARAQRRLELAAAFRLGQGGESVQGLLTATEAEATE
jgi:sensor domain CHASE-containing protein